VVLDDYSRAVCGYAVYLEAPSTLQTALALRQAIWRKPDPAWHVCGIPGVFYSDHGADFTSTHLEQVAVDLKLRLVFSTVGMPRGRGKIERFFATVHQLCLSALPGYAPPGAKKPPSRPALTLADLDRALWRFIVGDYHARQHSETGQLPQARWEAGGFLPRLPNSLEQLDLLLLCVARPRKVHPDGIHFQGLRYLDATLAAYVGEPVIIRYDPRDLAELRVFHRDRFLCRAICPQLAGQEVSLKELVAARTARRRELSQGLRERESLVARLLAVHRPDFTDPLPPPAPNAALGVDSSGPPTSQPRLKRYREE
jgi:putative transposase